MDYLSIFSRIKGRSIAASITIRISKCAQLEEYDYGASPTGAQILKTRTIGEQTFYVVKILFPRGDAASLLLGFNVENKITGISFMSMAGD